MPIIVTDTEPIQEELHIADAGGKNTITFKVDGTYSFKGTGFVASVIGAMME